MRSGRSVSVSSVVVAFAFAIIIGCGSGGENGAVADGSGDVRTGGEDGSGDSGRSVGDASDSEPDFSQAPPPPDPEVRFDPFDGRTNIDAANAPPRVVVRNQGDPVDDSKLQNLKKNVALIEWSGKTTVSVQKVVSNATGSGDYDPATIELRPNSTLADTWYALRIESLPSGLEWKDGLPSKRLSNGAAVARFRPDSHPLALGVRVCPDPNGVSAKVITSFSEEVSRRSGATRPAASQPGTNASCTSVPSQQPAKFSCQPYAAGEDLRLFVPDKSLESVSGDFVPGVDWTVDTTGMENGRCNDVWKTTRLP